MKIMSIACAAIIAVTSPALAQGDKVCMPAEELEASLVDWYGESLATQYSKEIYVWAAGVNQTWTIVNYKENGVSCVLAQGTGWTPAFDPKATIVQSNDYTS